MRAVVKYSVAALPPPSLRPLSTLPTPFPVDTRSIDIKADAPNMATALAGAKEQLVALSGQTPPKVTRWAVQEGHLIHIFCPTPFASVEGAKEVLPALAGEEWYVGPLIDTATAL